MAVHENVVSNNENTQSAHNKLRNNNLEFMIVIYEGRPEGYVNDEALKDTDTEVTNVTRPFTRVIHEDESLRDVMSHMLVSKVRHLPVVDSEGLISGTISYRDIQRCIRDIYKKNKL